MQKPESVMIGSIHKLQGRIIICTELWWDGEGLNKAVFYEPGTDKVNDCTPEELQYMIEKKQLELYAPPKGRVIRK